MPTLEQRDDVFVIMLGEGENLLTLPVLHELNDLLQEVEQRPGPKALVTKAEGRFWCNGFDLDWIGDHQSRLDELIDALAKVLRALLTLGTPSVAALQGHTFAGGALLALGHDFRVMRTDRGYLCLPELKLGIPFSSGTVKLVTAKLNAPTARDALTTGKRYTGADALAAGIVDAVGEGNVLPIAMELAHSVSDTAGNVLSTVKSRMYEAVVHDLPTP